MSLELTSSPAGIFDKSNIGQYRLTNVTTEAVRVPAVVHGFNYTANDELTYRQSRINNTQLQYISPTQSPQNSFLFNKLYRNCFVGLSGPYSMLHNI